MNATADKLIEALPGLPAADLRALQDHCAVLLKLSPSEPGAQAAPSNFAEVMYSAIATLLQKKHGVRYAPFAVFYANRTAFQKFAEACLLAEEANSVWFPHQTRNEKVSMCGLYAELVINRLEERETTVVMTTVDYWLGHLPALVDDAFPGYARAGLLCKVHALRTKKAK